MRKLERRHKVYRFDGTSPPVMEVEPGEALVVETTDSADGQIDLSGSGPLNVGAGPGRVRIDPNRAMPMTGPIYVRGAAPGDVLEAEILSVVATSNGFVLPGFDLLLEQDVPPEAGMGRILELRRGKIRFSERLQFPYRLMVGSLGVAPGGESVEALDPGDFGGNHDCLYLADGARLYLPIQVPGALVSLGDVHAAMGDGEVAGSAIECDGEVTLRLHVRRGWHIPGPVLEAGGKWMVYGFAPDTAGAIAMAKERAAGLLKRRLGLSTPEVYALLGATAHLRLNEVSNPHHSVRIEIPFYVAGQLIGEEEREREELVAVPAGP